MRARLEDVLAFYEALVSRGGLQTLETLEVKSPGRSNRS